jgi:tRNA nucleotidyltransferase (CCA-adding enzyme)
LNLQSNDIDVAVSDMTGLTFASHLASFVESREDVQMKDPVKVEANPEQSKHLETAKTGLWGLEIDLVNLRGEEYTEHSRIPKSTVSTSYQHGVDISTLVQVDFWHASRRCTQTGHNHQLLVLQCSYSLRRRLFRKGDDAQPIKAFVLMVLIPGS